MFVHDEYLGVQLGDTSRSAASVSSSAGSPSRSSTAPARGARAVPVVVALGSVAEFWPDATADSAAGSALPVSEAVGSPPPSPSASVASDEPGLVPAADLLRHQSKTSNAPANTDNPIEIHAQRELAVTSAVTTRPSAASTRMRTM